MPHFNRNFENNDPMKNITLTEPILDKAHELKIRLKLLLISLAHILEGKPELDALRYY